MPIALLALLVFLTEIGRVGSARAEIHRHAEPDGAERRPLGEPATELYTRAGPATEIYARTEPDGTVLFTDVLIAGGRPIRRSAVGLPRRAAVASRIPAELARIIGAAAARHGVPERLVTAVIQAESGFNPRALSHRGAGGLMQLMPATAAFLGVRDRFDPAANVDAGVRHLRGLLDRLGHDLPLALAAYNAGEQAVARHRGIPPYPETRDYVARIMRLLGPPAAPAP